MPCLASRAERAVDAQPVGVAAGQQGRREAEQTGCATWKLVNRRPSRGEAVEVGRGEAIAPKQPTSAYPWSSVKMITMFGSWEREAARVGGVGESEC